VFNMKASMALPPDLPAHFLRYFVLIAETRSFKVSAQKAHRSQPAISLAIKQLENSLGQPLFEPAERTRLTPFGLACLPLVKDFLRHQSRTVDALQKLSNNEFGKVTLACVPTAATHLLPDVLSRFTENFPGVDIALLDDNSKEIERMIVAEEVDFGICSCVSVNDQLTFEPLMQDRYGLVCSAANPIAQRTRITWDEVAAMPLLGSVAHQQILQYPDAPGLAEPHIFISNMMSLLSMLDRGIGVAVLAALAIPPYYADRLSFVPLSEPTIKRVVGIRRLAKRSLSPPVSNMLTLLKQHVATTLPALAVPAA
jgi:DNA-binding transcriptional LysR family regulator